MEEHVPMGGLCSIVKEASKLKNSINILYYSLQDKFIHFYGNHSELLEKHNLSPKYILEKIEI